MADLTYPELPGLAYNLVKRPLMSTLGGEDDASPSGDEVRLRQFQNPLWEFELVYEWLYDDATETWGTLTQLPDHQYQTLLGFFLQSGGSWQPFLLKDPTDNQVTAELLSATTVGGTKYSQLTRTIGGFAESMLAIDSASLVIKVAGIEQTEGVDYTFDPTLVGFSAAGVSWDGQYITWITDPGGGGIEAAFSFSFLCKFKKDATDFEKFAQSLWLNNKVEIRSVRRPNAAA
jgi:hypothetical protein